MANPLMVADLYSVYHKPTMGGQLILRKPRTNQRSTKVAAAKGEFSAHLSGKKIATACKGKKGRSFYGCLRTQGQAAYPKGDRKTEAGKTLSRTA